MNVVRLSNRLVDMARRVPFFVCLEEQDSRQWQCLLAHCKPHAVPPGESILQQGDHSDTLYFIVSGSVQVHADGHYLGLLPAGETFGDMALFLPGTRRASISASPDNSADSQVLSLRIAFFGELNDFSVVSRKTKLLFYRMLVQRARWRLEKNRIHYPHHPFFSGLPQWQEIAANDDDQELEALDERARSLTHALLDWNALGIEFGTVLGATGE